MALTPFFGTQDPFYSQLDRAFDRAFNRALSSATTPGFGVMDLFAPVAPAIGGTVGDFAMPMDVMEHPTSFEVIADAPGLSPEEVNIEVTDGVLTMSGRHREQHEEKDRRGRVVRSERVTRQFRRSFTLPETATEEGISANLDKGVLRVTIPKKPEAPKPQPKRIPIAGSTGGSQPAQVTSGGGGMGGGMGGTETGTTGQTGTA